ncbi:MAG: preprotein translocase subunit SecG [Bacillota bacterium]|nr:preprotein translocase subunit SecG [Bacillota bacterium]
MGVLKVVLLVVDLLACLGLIATILMQSSRSAGVSGTIGGASEQFFGKKKGLDEFLAKISTALAVVFFVISLVLALFFN